MENFDTDMLKSQIVFKLRTFDTFNAYQERLETYLGNYAREFKKPGFLSTNDEIRPRRDAVKQMLMPGNLNEVGVPKEGKEYRIVMRKIFGYLQENFSDEFKDVVLQMKKDGAPKNINDSRVEFLYRGEINKIRSESGKDEKPRFLALKRKRQGSNPKVS